MGGGNEMPERCPRCGEAVVPGATLAAIPQPLGYTPVVRLRHKRGDGKGCVAYLGVPEGKKKAGRSSWSARLR